MKDQVECYDIIDDKPTFVKLKHFFFNYKKQKIDVIDDYFPWMTNIKTRENTYGTGTYTQNYISVYDFRYQTIQKYGPVNYWNFSNKISFENAFNNRAIRPGEIPLFNIDDTNIKAANETIKTVIFKVSSTAYYMNNITFTKNTDGNIVISGTTRQIDDDTSESITDKTLNVTTNKFGVDNIDSDYKVKEYYMPPDMSGWNVSNVTNMKNMFSNSNFTGNHFTGTPNIEKTGDNREWYGDISKWDVSGVTNMESMFYNTSNFNGDLSKWDVSGVTNMISMFSAAHNFNGDLSKWDVSKVEDMRSMFNTAPKFNGDISKWNVSNVTNMESMFSEATSFDRNISKWDVSSVTNMNNMFSGTSSFYQNISDWDVENVVIPVAYKRPFSSYGGELMAIKNNDTVNKMSEEDLAAYNTINCMKPVKFRQVLAGYLSCP